MRLPSSRIRTLMIATVGFAILFALESSRRSHERQAALQHRVAIYTQKGAEHDRDSKYYRAKQMVNLTLADAARRKGEQAEMENLLEKARRDQALHEFHDGLKKKYALAAANPEDRLDADPLEPPQP